jgi:predicted XRE-type DNA-binding protein
MSEEIFETDSGNLFIDLGFSEEEAAELSIKACLFRKLQQILRESQLSQADLAKRLCIKQPHVSEILNGKMSGFSTERIAKYLLRLNYDIFLDTYPAPPGSKNGQVVDIARGADAKNSIVRQVSDEQSNRDKFKTALRQTNKRHAGALKKLADK